MLRAFDAKDRKSVVIRANVNISHPWRLAMGDHVWIGEDVGILSLAQVTIGSNVCISQRAYLCTGSHDFRREDFKLKVAPITVHDGSWVAATSFIAPGVEIGPGARGFSGECGVAERRGRASARGNPAVAEAKSSRTLKLKTDRS